MKSFYDLLPHAREQIAAQAIADKRTVLERWSALEAEETGGWDRRAEEAARFLRDCSSVADIGCGKMTLRRHLTAGVGYLPVDVVARDPDTLVLDLNRQPLPYLGTDAVAGLGLIEYIHDVAAVLHRMASYRVAVISYNPSDAIGAPSNRRQHIWVNDYTKAEISELFTICGFHIDDELQIGTTQTVWRLLGIRR